MSEMGDHVATAIFVAIAKKMKTDPICPVSEIGREAVAAMYEYLKDYDVEDWPQVFDEALK